MLEVKNLRFSKRGVSPLIATVLLIAFSVALGAVVMNWGRGFIKDKTEDVDQTTEIQLSCSIDVLIDFLEISDTKQVCYNSTEGAVYFTIDNQGTANVTGLSIQVINSLNDVFTNESIYRLVSGSAKRFRINDTNMGTAQYVSVSPMIGSVSTGTTQICTNNKIIVEDPDACT